MDYISYRFFMVLGTIGIEIKNWYLNLIGSLLVVVPVLLILNLLRKDESVNEAKRFLYNILFWFFVVSFGFGFIISLF